MVLSYLADAAVFAQNSDLVNQYASLAYAHGWLDAGSYLGFFGMTSSVPLFLITNDEIGPVLYQHLHEKTFRYQRMLSDAQISIQPSPEIGSPMRKAVEFILHSVTDGKAKGDLILSDGKLGAALGWYSYAYGWLDAALRSGFFLVTAHPELFTTESDLSR
jgi:uncharacterized protein